MAVSNLSPATLKEDFLTTPPKDTTANSDVPPPISTTIFPSGSKMFIPTPIAAAIGSSIKYASLAPASLVTSITALFSTCVIPAGTQIITLGLFKNVPDFILL